MTRFLTLETCCKNLITLQEVTRREQEISEKKAALDDMKRKNRLVQDKVKTIFLYRNHSNLTLGPRANKDPDNEAGRAEGRARD